MVRQGTMIKSIRIYRFQKHKKLELMLDPHITTITGRTDSGKSSVLRAFRWAALNQPNGNSFIHKGCKSARVEIELEDHVIGRVRGESNLYLLDDKEFVSFGTGVPDEITNLINVGDINFSSQFDSPFWFMQSPGEVSRELNSIVNLGLIDSTLSNLGSELRKSRSVVEVTDSRLKEANHKLTSLTWLDGCDNALKELESLEESIAQKRLGSLGIAQDLQGVSRLTQEASEGSEAILGASRAIEAGERLWENRLKQEKLAKLLDELEEVTKFSGVLIPGEELLELEESVENITSHREKLNNLQELLGHITRAEGDLEKVTALLGEAEEELSRASDGKCPVCGSET